MPASCPWSRPATTSRTSGAASSPRPAAPRSAITAAAVTKQTGDPVLLVRRADARSRSRMKPDVTAPGVDVASSVPPARGHVGVVQRDEHGRAARRRRRRPAAPAPSGLDGRADQVRARPDREARALGPATRGGPTTREGGGTIDLVPRANGRSSSPRRPSLSFGFVRAGAHGDAHGRAHRCRRRRGPWTVSDDAAAGADGRHRDRAAGGDRARPARRHRRPRPRPRRRRT